MDFFSEKGYLKVSTIKYVKKIMDTVPEEIKSTLNSTAVGHLFHIKE